MSAVLRARIAELEAENENLRHRAEAMTVRLGELRKLHSLVAELLAVLREYGEEPGQLERWRERWRAPVRSSGFGPGSEGRVP